MVDQNQDRPTRWQPLGAYRGLGAGPNWSRDTVASQSHAIDGTKQRLRDARLGSPFTFQVVPPSVLLNALLGGNGADTRDAFDPLLRQAFDNAAGALEAVLADPDSTPEEIAAAQQNLLGTRAPPNNSQDIDIIEAAIRSNNNFGSVRDQRNAFRRTNFFPAGPTRGAAMARPEDMVAANGVRFDPSRLGQSRANQAAVSDLNQALDVIVQLNRVLDTPPLTLLVNPESLTITYAKKQTYSDRNRYNYIFQSWGEEQVRLSVAGKSAGFVVGAGSIGSRDQDEIDKHLLIPGTGQVAQTASVSGYQYASKWDSAAWQNLMALFSFYRNNGYIYDTAGRPRSEAHLFVGNIQITFDQWTYLGQFENFQYNYVETKQQGAVDFSFEFTASFMYDRAQGGPVLPVDGPIPSPSAATRRGTPFLPNPQVKTTRGILQQDQGGDPSTAILDPFVDPFASSLQQRAAASRTRTVDPFAPTEGR